MRTGPTGLKKIGIGFFSVVRDVYPSETLRIMSSALQRKEIQKQKISNNSPISDNDLKQ